MVGTGTGGRFRQTTLLFLALALLVASAAGCATNDASSESKIDWLYDWSEALSRAQVEDKPIMTYFYTDVCPWCPRLESEVFADEEVGTFLNDNFVPLKSNAGKTTLHQDYGLSGVPTTVFTSPDGVEIGRIIGYKSAAEFRQRAEAILSQ